MSLEKAQLYETYRLPYTMETVDAILTRAGALSVVADVGSGTGQLARLFAGRCDRVHAVEPDPAMRQVAAEALRGCPNIDIVDACAEQTTLPDDSVDLIVIGNAFHRFRPDAIAELLRILKGSGWVAVIRYAFCNRAYSDALFPKLRQLAGIAARSRQNQPHLPVECLFGDRPVERLCFTRSVCEGWDAFWGAARSSIEAPGPDDEDFRHFQAINREVFDAFSVDGCIRIDYETHVHLGQPKLQVTPAASPDIITKEHQIPDSAP